MPEWIIMDTILEKLPGYVEAIAEAKEVIIANIVLLGQIPAPTFKERKRAQAFMDRLAGYQVDECTSNGYRNPIGIIRGTDADKPPIFLVAHLDTFIEQETEFFYSVKKNIIKGPGIIDNSVGVGVLASLPYLFKKLDLRFKSDIILAGVIQSIGSGNLRGIRHLVKTWSTPIRGAICIEGSDLGRLNYYTYGMKRCEVQCSVKHPVDWSFQFRPNAILILNELINEILTLRLPNRPRARVIIGRIKGGINHGKMAPEATLGFEIQSDSDPLVDQIFEHIQDIVEGLAQEHHVELKLKVISRLNGSRISYHHPLVKSAAAVMRHLGIKPVSAHTESELSIFLSKNIPAITLGITRGDHHYQSKARIHIKPMFTGIAQIIGVLEAMDQGACDA